MSDFLNEITSPLEIITGDLLDLLKCWIKPIKIITKIRSSARDLRLNTNKGGDFKFINFNNVGTNKRTNYYRQ